MFSKIFMKIMLKMSVDVRPSLLRAINKLLVLGVITIENFG